VEKVLRKELPVRVPVRELFRVELAKRVVSD
jgi:hypothetical protein